MKKLFDAFLFLWTLAVLAAAVILYFVPKFMEKFL